MYLKSDFNQALYVFESCVICYQSAIVVIFRLFELLVVPFPFQSSCSDLFRIGGTDFAKHTEDK